MGNAGFDYGNGLTNIDLETGIRYGVISSSEIGEAMEQLEPDYGEPTCGYCGSSELEEYDPDKHGENYDTGRYPEFACTECGRAFSSEDAYSEQPVGWSYEDAEYLLQMGGDDSDIFVLKSPYYTKCKFCSPCAPGAGYLTEQDEEGVRAYCLGHDWFDGGKAPYAIFRVEDNMEVAPDGSCTL